MDESNENKEKSGRQSKYSIKAYIIAMVIVVISVVILSYFASQRNSPENLESSGGVYSEQLDSLSNENEVTTPLCVL